MSDHDTDFAAVGRQAGLRFRRASVLIGVGVGSFALGILTVAMGLDPGGQTGLAVGAWGAVQTSVTGVAIALGGAIRDIVLGFTAWGGLGPVLAGPTVGYTTVYLLEIMLLLATLIAVAPLVRQLGKNNHNLHPSLVWPNVSADR